MMSPKQDQCCYLLPFSQGSWITFYYGTKGDNTTVTGMIYFQRVTRDLNNAIILGGDVGLAQHQRFFIAVFNRQTEEFTVFFQMPEI